MCDYAIKHCFTDYVDEKNNCSWYHCAWAYLRLLDCVSAPQWHETNYRKAIERYLKGFRKTINILISGTADYSMLYLIIDEIYKENKTAIIYVLDKCPSPIRFCEEYVNELASDEKKQYINSHIKIRCKEEDILRTDINNFDIICTDAFLTRFTKSGAASVVKKWYDMLNEKGVIITTVRIHYAEKKSDLLSVSKSILRFEKKVSSRYDDYIKQHQEFPISKEKLLYLANRYIIKMDSNSLGREEDIKELFNPIDLQNPNKPERFELNCKVTSVQGEIDKTDYLFVEARRK